VGYLAPRRRALRRARVAPQVRCLGRGAVLVCAVGRTRWRRQRTPAPRPGRAYQLLPVLVREPGCPVCRDANHVAPCLGEPPRWRVSICVEPAFEPRTLFCRCLCARVLAGHTPARLGFDLAVELPSAPALGVAPRAVAGVSGGRPSSRCVRALSVKGWGWKSWSAPQRRVQTRTIDPPPVRAPVMPPPGAACA
jgi:hypothetical protein